MINAEQSKPLTYDIKIKMLKTVRPDLVFLADPGTVLYGGYTYFATANKYGAICGICDNGKELGVKPGEFEFVEAPDWVLNRWSDVHD